MDGNKKRLERLETALMRQQDPVYTVTLTTGETVTCTYEEAWGYFKSGQGQMVEAVTVDRDDYAENAAALEMLCRS